MKKAVAVALGLAGAIGVNAVVRALTKPEEVKCGVGRLPSCDEENVAQPGPDVLRTRDGGTQG